ncbi:hypothetical protein [Gloeothece verrucosa]|uniref:Uncharacterized protein n=1 Tax=Gloeothece verrucosa (strain PCC 7822) TaxID=497965 RepID=E0UJI4_GLOV7|nr:hypothetical protein [Gloeothece verrucosa]ADN17002.1 conserved hypothetical protein [Gloeothece verrucosa PCC 7822]
MTILTSQFNLRTDNNGVPGAILNSPLNTGDSFFVEVLMGDFRSNAVGITSSNINLSFAPNQLQNINKPFDTVSLSSPLLPSSFYLGRTGNLDNNNGVITNLGAGSIPSFGIGSPIGINQLDTFSLFHFQVIGMNNSILTLNIDLSQTGFADGTFANQSPNQNQFAQTIMINHSQPIPESSPILAIFLLGTLLLLKKFLILE